MIRFLLYILVFGVGLVGAAAWFGEMRHLRDAVPEKLPPWSVFVDDHSRLNGGTAELGLPGTPKILVEWTGRAPNGDGLNWDLVASGTGLLMQAELVVPYWPNVATVRGGKGTVSLDELTNGAIKGLVPIDKVQGKIPLINRSSQPPGYVEITFADTASLTDSVRNGLDGFGTMSGNVFRIPVALP